MKHCLQPGFDGSDIRKRDAADFDITSDLSDDTYETFGVTLFHRGGKPTVKLARERWEQR